MDGETPELTAPPQYSPDRRWYWNGREWIPTPVKVPRLARLSNRTWVIILAGFLVAFVAVWVLVATGRVGQADLARCETVSPEMMTAIESGSPIPGYYLLHAQAVRSHDRQRIYFISADVHAPGLPDTVGTWASNRLEPGAGSIWAIDDIAHASTRWPQGDGTDPISMNEDGAQFSRDCVAAKKR